MTSILQNVIELTAAVDRYQWLAQPPKLNSVDGGLAKQASNQHQLQERIKVLIDIMIDAGAYKHILNRYNFASLYADHDCL